LPSHIQLPSTRSTHINQLDTILGNIRLYKSGFGFSERIRDAHVQTCTR